MILVNTSHITDTFLSIRGTEPADVLELTGDVTAEGEIRYDLTASMAGQDLVVRGEASVQVKAECARCLRDVARTLCAKEICIVRENVPAREVDITSDIREELLLTMPSRFLCSEDCKGLCPGCGANLNEAKCACGRKKKGKKEQPPEESPWSVLDQLKPDR